MKKIVSLIALCAITTVMTAGDLTGVRIYLNPGHGGWNGVNDRHIETIPFPEYVDGHVDTLGFWESSSNLKVAYDLYKCHVGQINQEHVIMVNWTGMVK